MKKLLVSLQAALLIGATTSSVAACGAKDQVWEITVDTWTPVYSIYEQAATKVNNQFEADGLKWRVKLKETSWYDTISNLQVSGVRSKSIPDLFPAEVFMLPEWHSKNMLYNFSSEAAKTFNGESDLIDYGIKLDENGKLDVANSHSLWALSQGWEVNGQKPLLGVPYFVNSQFGIGDSSVVDIADGEITYNGNTYDASLTGFKEINADKKGTIAFRSNWGWLMLFAFNGIVEKYFDEISSKTSDEFPTVSWLKNEQTDLNKIESYSSLLEEEPMKTDFLNMAKQLLDFSKTVGDELIYGFGSSYEQSNSSMATQLQNGTTKFAIATQDYLETYANQLKQGGASVEDIKVTPINQLKFNISDVGAATQEYVNGRVNMGAWSWTVKSTINTTQTYEDNDGNLVDKPTAALKFLKEISSADYSGQITDKFGLIPGLEKQQKAASKYMKETSTKEFKDLFVQLIDQTEIEYSADLEDGGGIWQSATPLFGIILAAYDTAFYQKLKKVIMRMLKILQQIS
ncbi:putative lipoprotein [Spiroplasma clarkii]|uniref:hypothetical protein n=1 Tax=Spiroplasma clarkii TaxID=2139 RepID=UPI000B569643|nr:hypothetical protein [Spiroplasma clarkii]ARU91371.1 putative lipoprotein [Spiroplasma clarkii]